jgi:hypothetical protein
MGVSENRGIPVHPKICCCTWENDDPRSDLFRHQRLATSPEWVTHEWVVINTAGEYNKWTQ